MSYIRAGDGAKPPSTPKGNAMPRATRNRTLIAQARVSAPELAKWRAAPIRVSGSHRFAS